MRTKSRVIDHGVQKGIKDFQTLKNTAVRNTLDTCAGLTRRNAVKNVKDDFTLRNNFTVANIRFEKVATRNIGMMQARAGATEKASYLRTQEEGGDRLKRGAVTAIGKAAARAGNSMARPVSRGKYITKIQPRIVKGAHKKKQPSHQAYGVAQMAVAFKKKKFLKRNSNIYTVESFSSVHGKVTARLKHIYNIQTKTIKVNRETWLEPAIIKPANDLPRIYKSNLKKLWKYADIK